jgi:hypothetical protein
MSSTYNYLGIELMATGENAGTWGTKTNTNLDIIQQAATGFHSQTIAGGAQTTNLGVANGDSTSATDSVTNAARNAVVKLTGTITGNQVVTVPNQINSTNFERLYLFENATTGAYTVELRTASGAAQSGATFSGTDKGMKLMYCDGTQLYDTGFGAATGAAGSNTQIQFNNSGSFGGSANLTWDGTNVLIDADGALRLGDSAGSGYVGLQAPATITGDSPYTLKLPVATGSADQILVTDGSGNLSFTDNSGGTAWQAVITAASTAVTAGNGYFINTTSNACTATLPASPTLGDEISFVDYAGTFDTNNLTVARNGKNIQGSAADLTVATERAGFTLVFTDNTQGWLLKNN